MKKIILFGLVITVFLALSLTTFANEQTVQDDSIVLKEAAATKAIMKNNLEHYQIAICYGEPVYSDEFLIRYNKALATNSKNPYEDTVAGISLVKSSYYFAKKYNIVVSDNDVLAYTSMQRNICENQVDQDLKDAIQQYIQALGLTADEYWNEYKLKENKDYLTYCEVKYYEKDNNIKSMPIEIENFKVIDKNFEKTNFQFERSVIEYKTNS